MNPATFQPWSLCGISVVTKWLWPEGEHTVVLRCPSHPCQIFRDSPDFYQCVPEKNHIFPGMPICPFFWLGVPHLSWFAHFCSHMLTHRCYLYIWKHRWKMEVRPGPRWKTLWRSLKSDLVGLCPPTIISFGAHLGLWCPIWAPQSRMSAKGDNRMGARAGGVRFQVWGSIVSSFSGVRGEAPSASDFFTISGLLCVVLWSWCESVSSLWCAHCQDGRRFM